MNWKEIISRAYEISWNDIKCKPIFYPPASEDDINKLEKSLGVNVPPPLKELLLETNGFGEEIYIDEKKKDIDLGSFLFSTGEIVEITLGFQDSGLSTNISFDEFVFIGTPHVDGIYFALRKNEDQVYAWYPEDLEFRSLAPNLRDFIVGWLSESLSF